MKASEFFWVVAIGVVTTVIGAIIADKLMQRGPAAVLPFKKPGDCGCKGA